MKQMAAPVRAFWETLSEEDKKELARRSRIICRTVETSSTRRVCLENIQFLANKYSQIKHCCYPIIQNPDFADETITLSSDIQVIKSYFSQFCDAVSDVSDSEQSNSETASPTSFRTSGKRVFLVHNSFHGDIVCQLANETGGSYYFDYVKGGEIIFQNWRVLKNSNRVIKEIFD